MKTPDKRTVFHEKYEFVLFAALLSFFPRLVMAAEDGAEEPPVAVLTHRVTDDVARSVRRYPARVRAIEQVEVVTRLSADIEEIGFVEGETVAKGQLLYRLDDVRYAAAVSNQLAKVAEIDARLKLAEQTYARKKALAGKDMAPRADLDAASAERNALAAQLAAERAALVLAEDDLRHTRIVSPIAGRIGLTAKTVGNYVTPESGVLARVVRTDPLRVRFSLSLTDYAHFFGGNVARLKSEAEVSVRPPQGVDSLPKGEIEFVDVSAVERTDTVLVYVRQPNPEGRLVPDGAVTLELSVAQPKRLPWIPPQAVLDDGETAHVFIVEDGVAVLRAIEVEAELHDRVYVASGLKVGETVVSGGVHKVTDGAPVTGQEDTP